MKKIIFYLLHLTLAFALTQCKVKDVRQFIYSKMKNKKSIKSKMKPKVDSLYLGNFHLENWKYSKCDLSFVSRGLRALFDESSIPYQNL